jgi:acyl-CoA reductase-like NAD-dependent aldehyde dehydrogenase
VSDPERSRRQADELAQRAHTAARAFAEATQGDVDRVVRAMAKAGAAAAERLAALACEETGYGRTDHKTFKNLFNTEFLYEEIRAIPTVGVIAKHPERRVVEIAEPVGVVAALIPVTNPTSTVLFKSLCAVKGRNAIVCAPHPRAARCCAETVGVLQEAAEQAGAPPDLAQCLTDVTIEGTDALMRHRRTDLILATGSRQMVLAAYSCGKPTHAVGPGNVPAYVHTSVADAGEAAAQILASRAFDYGTACTSEQAVVVDAPVAARVRAELEARGAHFCREDEQAALERLCFPPGGGELPSTEIVGQSPARLAQLAGLRIPERTRVLVVAPRGVGREHALSRELLCPILKWYEARSEDEALELCEAVLHFGGDGHTAVLHADDDAILARYARMPAYRIVVNNPALHGAAGYSTGLDATFMIGTGTIGGAISSDNIGPRHLINVKRIALPTRSWREDELAEDDAAPTRAPDLDALVREVVEKVLAGA